jgi:hypothetical protein
MQLKAVFSHSPIDPTPVLAVLQCWESDLAVYEHRDPSGATANTLKLGIAQIRTALREGSDAPVYLNIPATAARIHRPVSTVRRWCKQHGATIGARKVDAQWIVDWRVFEQWVLSEGNASGAES